MLQHSRLARKSAISCIDPEDLRALHQVALAAQDVIGVLDAGREPIGDPPPPPPDDDDEGEDSRLLRAVPVLREAIKAIIEDVGDLQAEALKVTRGM